jgi:hypothetical protein
MHIRQALAGFALAALHIAGAAAQTRPPTTATPLGVYYPAAQTCPVPSRIVDAEPDVSQPALTRAQGAGKCRGSRC